MISKFKRASRYGFVLGLILSTLACSLLVSRLGLAYATEEDADNDSHVYRPPDYMTFQPPAKGGSYTDPVFGTAIKRVTDAMNTNDPWGGKLSSITTEYSSMTAFNKDNTRLLLQHFSYFSLYDGAGNFIKDLFPTVMSFCEPRWSRTDPNELYFIAGNQLKKLNVGTDAVSTVRTFSEYSVISGKGESDISFDGNYFVFAGDSRYVFLYNVATDTKGPVREFAPGSFDQLYITPNNNVIVGFYAVGSGRSNGIELYDKDMNFQRQLAHAIGHMDVMRDSNGTEVALWANGRDPELAERCDAGVTRIRLSDGEQTCVWWGDWSMAEHISAPDNGEWFFMNTYTPSDPMPSSAGWVQHTNEILQIKVDGSEIKRLAHHRSRPFNTYTYTPRLSVSRDGSRFVYASNFGLQREGWPAEYSDVYLIDSDLDSLPEPPPLPPLPPPPPTPIDPPTTSGTRIEEDASAVTYAGGWIGNNLVLHSGGSAKLATHAGDSATLAFNGTGASWIAYRDEWSGIARVYVDGVLKGEVDTYLAPGKAQAAAYSISGLPAGNHTLKIEATGRGSSASRAAWIWVDAFTVTSTVTSEDAPGVGTRVEQDGNGIAYSGEWAANGLAFHSRSSAVLSLTAGARATFVFNGSEVTWIAYRDAWSGIARVYLDGTLKGTIDTYSADDKAQASMYSISGLSSGTHTLVIEVTGTKNPLSDAAWIWIDGFDVSSTGTLHRIEQSSPAVAWSGSWSQSNGAFNSGSSARLTMEAGSRASFIFTGNAVSWIAYRDEWSGIAKVYIDGVLKGEIDTYASPSTSKARVYTVSDLAWGPHTIVVEATGRKTAASGGAWVWVDAFDYMGADPQF